MRPISMKIKGLNSFGEAQEIDFVELTSRGLFGIFGPTGSGKSSILDGITIALYGATARNSSNFINVNTDQASVDYRFSIKEKQERIYRVFRSFKRTKEGSIRSEGARFSELMGEKEEILADKVGMVNEKCREVIGLSKEDFFRTVVLPQGKFSEFLRLEGMERNKMLERLFHLEKYGEQLVVLIKAQENQWEGKQREMEGALSRYGEVSQEQMEEQKIMEEACAREVEKSSAQVKESREKLEKDKRIFELQTEYEKLRNRAGELEKRQMEFQHLEETLEKNQRANLLWEYLKEQQETEQAFQETLEEKEKVLLLWTDKNREKGTLQEEKEAFEERFQKEKPALEIRKMQIQESIQLMKEKEKLEKEKEAGKEEQSCLDLELKTDHEKMDKLNLSIDKLLKDREQLKENLESITFGRQEQQWTEEGFHLEKEAEQLKNRKKSSEEKIENFRVQREKTMAAQNNFMQREENLEKQKAVLFYRTKNLQKQICQGLEQEKQEVLFHKAEAEKERKLAESLYKENLAAILAADLQEGLPCPVCGSVHHEMVFPKSEQKDTQRAEEKRLLAEGAIQKWTAVLAGIETRLAAEEEQYQVYEERCKALSVKAIAEDQEVIAIDLKAALTKTEQELKNLEQALHALQIEKTQTESAAKSLEERQKEEAGVLQEISEELAKRQKRLLELTQKTQVKDFATEYTLLQEKRKKQEEITSFLDKAEKALEARRANREKGISIIQEKTNKKARLDLTLKQLEENIEKQRILILEKAGTCENLEEKLAHIEKTLLAKERELQEVKAKWKLLAEEEESLQQKKAALEASTETERWNLEKKKEVLHKKMKENQIDSAQWILDFKKEEKQLLEQSEDLKYYKDTVKDIQTRLLTAKEQLKGRSISKEELEAEAQAVLELEERLTEGNKRLGALRKEKEQLEKAWKEKKTLMEKLEVVYHKLDILSELSTLFKGKRFVEYVSKYRLEAISREADAKLKEMTGNGYGLETDGNGIFMIRDYKNGGICRPASTLSGGETFMASLALALALSSQIQMKGAAPLELFFLDEGFGTLDETYLDVVMESLEKIRSQKRSVGVITHVEEIKARIPVRLVVEPAKMGEGGSKVHIEHE